MVHKQFFAVCGIMALTMAPDSRVQHRREGLETILWDPSVLESRANASHQSARRASA